MILAIYGRSAAGKTTIAEIMASRLQLPVRHCGIAIRAAATEFGTGLAALPKDVHRRVDAETSDWCDQHTEVGGIIERRFLDSVLRVRDDVLFVNVRAELDERARRMVERSSRHVDLAAVLAIDAEDDLFRSTMYSTAAHTASLDLDTTGGTASLWAEKLEQFARNHMGLLLG
jgi:cytidylate kinase